MAGGGQHRRVLFLTHHLPWPATSGGRLREAQLLDRLAHGFDIDLIAISKVPEDDRRAVDEALIRGIRAHVFAAHRSSRPNLSPHVRRHQSATARAHLASWWSRHPDCLVHVEGHYLLGLLPPQARSRALVVEHNIESTLFGQQADIATSARERRRLRHAAALTQNAEGLAWRTAAAVGAITTDDRAVIRRHTPSATVHHLPNGADHLHVVPLLCAEGEASASDLLFVGNFAYPPSQDAARWLLTTIFPAVTFSRPSTTLTFVGSAPSAWLQEAAQADSRVRVTGPVSDLAGWLDAAQVVVCPLRIGGGVKVKVLEALSRGRAVVTTPVGSQGLGDLPAGALIVRDDASSIAQACLRLLASAEARRSRQQRARDAARLLPTWDQAAEALARVWDDSRASITHRPALAVTPG
jgi:glycosyltransferase involved in cell wall biosynthesis